MKKVLSILLALLMLALGTAALAEGSITHVTLGAAENVCYVGHGLQLKVQAVRPADAQLPEASAFTWTSGNEGIATVDVSGLVTGVKRGSTTITATLTGTRVRGTFKVTVKQAPTAITLSANSLVMAEGRKERITAKLEPSHCDDKRIEWSSSDTSLCTVDKNGNIHCLSAGSVTITATSVADPSVSASIQIAEEEPVTSVAFLTKEATVKVGESIQLGWTAQPDTSTHAVTFSSNHEKTATVNASGVATGVKAGRCTITVMSADGTRKKGTLTLNVVQPITGLSLKDSEVRVGVGNYVSLYAETAPKDATDDNMTWVSADESIATVTGNGLHAKVHGHAWGDTTVTGTTEDGSFSVTATIHVGSFSHALKVEYVKIRNGKPYLEVKNVSNLGIVSFSYVMRGFDEQVHPVQMATHGRDLALLYGTYEHDLQPGAQTVHGEWSFRYPSDYADLERLDFCVTGFTTADGFSYTIPESHRKWVEFDSDLYTQIQNNPRAN